MCALIGTSFTVTLARLENTFRYTGDLVIKAFVVWRIRCIPLNISWRYCPQWEGEALPERDAVFCIYSIPKDGEMFCFNMFKGRQNKTDKR